MNVLSVTSVLPGDPVRRGARNGFACEFRLAVDSLPRRRIVVEAGRRLAERAF